MLTISKQIDALTDLQVLTIIDSLAGEFSASDTPESRNEQEQVLSELMAAQDLDPSLIQSVNQAGGQVGIAARELLQQLAEDEQILSALEKWLKEPPIQESAAIPLVLAAPVIFTGCILLLQVSGHVRLKRYPNGTWEIEYDPAKKAPMDRTIKDLATIIAGIISHINGA
jgi:hypothetical protein